MDKHKNGIADIHRNIRKLLKNQKKGLRSYTIRDMYARRYGKHYSESGFTARLREMGDIVCDRRTYEYTLIRAGVEKC